MRNVCKLLSVILAVLLLNCSAVADEACQHTFNSYVLKEATCTESGILMQQCALCAQRSYSAVEPKHSYNETPDVVVPPTCDEEGGKVWYCTVCNTHKDPEAEGVYCETVPSAHSYSGEIRYIPAMCEEKGKFVRTCTVCGEEEVLQLDESSVPLKHDWQYMKTPADCENAAKEQIACTICGKVRWEKKNGDSKPLGHTMPEEYSLISQADCENAAVAAWDCAVCGKHIEEAYGEPCGHTLQENVIKEATCYEEGLVNQVCSVCGELIAENVTVPMRAECEPYDIIIAPPTCTENGIREYRCKWCDQHLYFAAMPFGHEAGDVETVQAPTCTENGLGQVHCMVCEALLKEIVLPAAGHAYTHDPVLRTVDCTNESYAVLICDVCGEEMICAEDEEKEKPVHQLAYRYTAPDCLNCGLLEVYCAVCDAVISQQEVYDDAALGHLYAEEKTVIKTPDCENPGLEAWVCTRCNHVQGETDIPACGHALEMQTVREATCYEAGLANRVCTVCSKTVEEEIILEQKPACEAKQEILIAPTCTSDGLCQYVCKWCDLLMGYDIMPAGHIAGEPVLEKAPTCTEEGLERINCSMCGELMEERTLPCTEHVYPEEETQAIAATCTEPAVLLYSCTVCGSEEAVKKVPAGECLGHIWKKETQLLPADCVTPGRTVKVCTVCGETQTVAYDRAHPAHGHQITYMMIEPTCTEPMLVSGVCSVCGYEIEREPAGKMEGVATSALGHTLPEEWIVETEPTCMAPGLRTKACTVCGEVVVKEEIPAVPCEAQLECVLQEASCINGKKNVALMNCRWCGEFVRVDVEDYEHIFRDEQAVVLLEAGCETEGLLLKVCENCGYEQKAAIPPVGHLVSEPTVQPADCEHGERIVIYCSRCNEVLSIEAEMSDALGHEFGVFDPQIGKNVCIYCRAVQPD